MTVQTITSRDNALLKDLRRLSQDSTAYRKQGRVWLEGDHLCRAALDRGVRPSIGVFAQGVFDARWEGAAERTVLVPDPVFQGLSSLESPASMAFVIQLPVDVEPVPGDACVILDGVQDAGNVGAILRCASAFGFVQVLATRGTAALWSPKVLRAGMGAHFGLRLVEAVEPEAVEGLHLPVIATSSHQGDFLHRTRLPWPCAWVFGHEGQGVGERLSALARQWVRIVQPGGEESLNVATAAAICLHASAASRDAHDA